MKGWDRNAIVVPNGDFQKGKKKKKIYILKYKLNMCPKILFTNE